MSATLYGNPNPQTQPNDGAPGAGEAFPSADASNKKPTKALDEEEMLLRFIEWFKASRDHWQRWRQEAMSCFDFVAGNQWEDDDLKILQDQSRPAITWNRIQPFVDAVSGLEIGNRQTTTYLPRQVGKTGVNELLTGACQWARDECDAEDEESEAVKDNIVCGIGCTQTRMDYDIEPDGMIKIDRVDPLEIYPDPSSRKPNFADARFVIRVKDLPVKTAEEMFPDYAALDLHAQWAEDQPDDTRQPHNARLAPYYRIDQAGEVDRQRMQVRLVEVEWWDYVTAYRVLDPTTRRFVRLGEADANKYRTRAAMLGHEVPYMIRDRERKYYKAIVGNVIIKVMRGPDQGGFSYKFMTGKRDRNHGVWYGLVRALRDPQMWANKLFTQSLHIVNVNAKGGLLAETGAFVDIEEARDSWADADSITELNPGGLAMVEQKNPPQFPVQISNMMEMAVQAIPSVAGVNLELIAQQDKDQPGILEMQRKQQGMTVLAYIFDAKRRYQKEQGRLMLWMLQTFITDGRLIRIGGPEDAQFVPLVHEDRLLEYDVVVDEAPSSPNMKERVWAMIMQMFPMLKTMNLPPQAMTELMKYSPFPAALVQSIGQIMSQPQQNPETQAKIAEQNAKAAKMNAESQKITVDAQLAPQNMMLEHQKLQGEVSKQQADVEKARADALNALQDAGIQANDAHFQNMLGAVDMLLQAHAQGHDQYLAANQQAHEQGLEMAQHQLAQQQTQHDQAMAQQQQALAAQGQAQDQQMAQQEHQLAAQGQQHDQRMAKQEHSLARKQSDRDYGIAKRQAAQKAAQPARKK